MSIIYSPKKFRKLYDYKESIKDPEIKELITEFLSNYNLMYIKVKDVINQLNDRKFNYIKLERLGVENLELKSKLRRKENIIKNLLSKEEW